MLVDYIEGHKCESAFSVIYKTAKLISEKGHDVTFVSPSLNSKKTIDKKETKTLRVINTAGILPLNYRKGGFGILDLLYKSKIILNRNFDVIHSMNGLRPAQFIPSLVGKYFKKSIIIDEWWEWFGNDGIAATRSGLIGKCIGIYDSLIEMPSKKYFNGVIAISHGLEKRMYGHANSIVLHGGADTDNLIDYEMGFARKCLELSQELFIIGMSNLVKDDFYDNNIFFKAFIKIQKQYKNVRLFVTGDRAYICEWIASFPAKDKVIYSGWLDFATYNKYMSACNIFVLPFIKCNRNAGRWPNKVGDYLCLNRPIITNPTGDLLKFFAHNKIGFLCDESVGDYYQLLKEILSGRYELSKYHQDSKRVALDVLDFKKRVENIILFYESCLSKQTENAKKNH